MAQIFFSHSKKDEQQNDFFRKVFSTTRVKGVIEEFEQIDKIINSEKIKQDISLSSAIFVSLGPNTDNILHTRDWILWESGAAANRDIWVFEPIQYLGKINVAIPHLSHYVIYDTTDPWMKYIRNIVNSYDDYPTLLLTLLGSALGALAGGNFEGMAIGAIGMPVLFLTNRTRPNGKKIKCSNCSSIYEVHIPSGLNFYRCPICNASWKIELGILPTQGLHFSTG